MFTFKGSVVRVVVAWLYLALQESDRLQATAGKRAPGIRVTDLSGNRISFVRAVGRHFARFISCLIVRIGFLIVLWDKRRQALHDKIASTLFVR